MLRRIQRGKKPKISLGPELADSAAYIHGLLPGNISQIKSAVARPEGITVHDMSGVRLKVEWSQIKGYTHDTMLVPPQTQLVEREDREVFAVEFEHPNVPPHSHLMILPAHEDESEAWQQVLTQHGVLGRG